MKSYQASQEIQGAAEISWNREGEESIAHCKFVVFTFLPFTFLPFEGTEVEDGAVSRSDTETPGAQASYDGLGAPSDS